MSSSSDEVDPAELQREEEQRRREAENRIWEAEEKRARRDAEREKKRVAAEACRQVEEEAAEAARKKSEEEAKKSQSVEADKKKKTPGASVVRPQENEAGSVRSAGRRSGPENLCANCTWLEIESDEPLTKKSHGKEQKRRRQGSPNYREKGSQDGIGGDKAEEEREDVIGAMVEAIVAFTEQYKVEVAAVTGFRRELIYELGGIRVATQALARAYLQDRAARQEGLGVTSGSGSGVGAKKVGEASGSKKVDPKGKGKRKSDPKENKPDPKGKGKGRAVDEDEDMDISDGKGDGEDDKDAAGTLK
ncbi:hypothetical protein PAXINDRAFT_20140 [Paxillus involutus ATCC 200175]|uniref:Uncharacterized protein n=1 Tax=Paxillus involutus ATCC 200175 TaxID=664439 RepID=A0A0C9T5X6_PAXIN|nr:hypothetical protein PAXINDRAFT_20140 [Paxillus involutus ATCC 200175]